jgi:hypothetical protein
MTTSHLWLCRTYVSDSETRPLSIRWAPSTQKGRGWVRGSDPRSLVENIFYRHENIFYRHDSRDGRL